MIHLLIFLLCLIHCGRAQQTFFPAAIPLAVRSPYLNCWDFTTNGTAIGHNWPSTSASGDDHLSATVHVRVDNITYSFLGGSPFVNGSVNLTDMVITPTQTKLTAKAGPMQFNLTFLNPIEPGDWVKQSIPFSYLSLTAESLDSAAHAVQVYSDVTGEWLSGDRSHEISWSTNTTDPNVVYHVATLTNPDVFKEIKTQAEWGTLYYAMLVGNGDKVTYRTGMDDMDRRAFQDIGTLPNTRDPRSRRTINDALPGFAISRDLGTIQATQDPVVWAVGFTTDPAIQYIDPSTETPQRRSLYYKADYSDDTSLILYFLNDFANASSRAQQLDSKILQAATAVSGELGDLVSLATAQVYGSIQVTIGSDASGKLNRSDVMAFMKNIGDGTITNRVNAVETLYSAFPALMFIDPALGGLLLKPLFQLQASPSYTKPYAAADIGSNYPNVTVRNLDHDQGVEQSGNMLIMTYAQARATGDGSLISRYYPLLTSWADYLSNSTLLIQNQLSADGLGISNQTNLAIKGIIAIEAMSKMSSVVDRTADADKYSNTTARLYSQWKGLALASDQHLLAAYGLADSWTLGYNLFADVWLNTSVVESSVYDGQSSFVDNVTLTSNFSNYGMPTDNTSNRAEYAASSWNLFVAAMTPNPVLRTNLISRVHSRASYNTTADVFPVYYYFDGTTYREEASPAQGAMYAPLALKASVLPITVNPLTAGKSQSHTGAIAGGVIGGIAALLAIGVIALVVRHRRRSSRRRKSIGSSSERGAVEPDLHSPTMIVTPFDLTLARAADEELETRFQSNWEQRGAEPVEPEIVSLLHAATPSELPVPSPYVVPIPVGLSSKELARLRQDNSHSRPTVALPSGPLLTATAGRGVATSSLEARRLRSEVESLRREMQELRAERSRERSEAPPDYSDGGA